MVQAIISRKVEIQMDLSITKSPAGLKHKKVS